MNLKFSRELKKTNKEFVLLFSKEATIVQQALEANKKEELRRSKFDKLLNFYQEYADKELTRIITTIMSKSHEADN